MADPIQQRSIQKLLKHPELWRADQIGQWQETCQAWSSGFEALDTHLPGKGWPRSGLIELLLTRAGIGELGLLVPVMRTLTQQQRWVVWLNPPFTPYAAALNAAGIDLQYLLVIRTTKHVDSLWALERAAKTLSCGAIWAWLSETKLQLKDTQRLQVASKQGNTLLALLRPLRPVNPASMAELRLALQPQDQQLQVDILKRRGGWPISGICLDPQMPLLTTDVVAAQLELWRLQRPQPDKLDHTEPLLPPLAAAHPNQAALH